MSVRTACILVALVLAAARWRGPNSDRAGIRHVPGSGRVTDATSGAAMTGASVSIGQQRERHDHFQHRRSVHAARSAGQAQLEAAASGYAKVTMPIDVPTRGFLLDIRLSRVP